jgi:hypothetical protein
MNTLKKLEKNANCWFLIIISVIFFFLRFPSLFEPNWYGDEGIYQTLGLAINAGRLLYQDIFDNKPPLLYFLYSIVNSDLFAIRALSLIFGLLAILAFYVLSKKLLKKQRSIFIATGFFAILFGLPLIEGNIANAENFMLLPNIISALLVLKSLETNKKYLTLFSAGIVLGFSFLLKIVAIFDFAAFFVFLAYVNLVDSLKVIFDKKILLQKMKILTAFTSGFLAPIIFVSLFFLFKGAYSYYLQAVLFNNVSYVGYGNKFIIPQGLLILKLILLSIFSLFIFFKKSEFGKEFSFISLWFAFSLFNAFFSQRPYTHYVLVILPSFCLMLGFFYLNKNLSKLTGIFVISSFILILLSFSFYLKTLSYYQNFLSFIFGAKNVYAYQNFFDRNTPRDYELANYINLNTNKKDNIFIWGNNAQVYQLTNKLPPGRYTVAYHITSYRDGRENTRKEIEVKKPKFLIIMPNVPTFPFSFSMYYKKVNLEGIEIYERVSY